MGPLSALSLSRSGKHDSFNMLAFVTLLAAVAVPASAIRIPGGHDVQPECITQLENGATFRAGDISKNTCTSPDQLPGNYACVVLASCTEYG